MKTVMAVAVLEESSPGGMQVLFSCRLYYVPYHFYGRAFSCTCGKPIHHLNIHRGLWAFIWPFGHKSHVIHFIEKRFVEISINYAGCNFSSQNTIHWFVLRRKPKICTWHDESSPNRFTYRICKINKILVKCKPSVKRSLLFIAFIRPNTQWNVTNYSN